MSVKDVLQVYLQRKLLGMKDIVVTAFISGKNLRRIDISLYFCRGKSNKTFVR